MMNNLPLQSLVWGVDEYTGEPVSNSLLHGYIVMNYGNGKFKVAYYLLSGGTYTKFATGFATIDEAKAWAWNHYNEKMQPYVKPDSITDIRNWFKAAKPEPTDKDRLTQIGCHFEEVDEMITSILPRSSLGDYMSADELAREYKNSNDGDVVNKAYFNSCVHNLGLLDALCDQIVTATGVAYMMGFDIEGALKEVVRSNNSKMVDGKFTFDDNGKIMKPDSYSEPDLTPFLNKGE